MMVLNVDAATGATNAGCRDASQAKCIHIVAHEQQQQHTVSTRTTTNGKYGV